MPATRKCLPLATGVDYPIDSPEVTVSDYSCLYVIMDNSSFYKPRHVPHYDLPLALQFLTICVKDKSTLLNIPNIATSIIEAWKFLDARAYDLIAWVVMPDHIHILIKLYEGEPLSRIVKSRKSYSGFIINRQLGITGAFWQKDYWDTVIRDSCHLKQVLEYIDQNPVKAGLVERAEEYPWLGFQLSRIDFLDTALGDK